MIQVKRKTDKNNRPKSPEEQIKELQAEIITLNDEKAQLQEQVDLMQQAVDEMIMGGAL